MTREETIKICKSCINSNTELKRGMICGITNELANFDKTCISYEKNPIIDIRDEFEEIREMLDERKAGAGKRFANYILDMVFLWIFALIIGFLFGTLFLIISPDSLSFIDEDSILQEYLFGFVIGMIYYSFFEATSGRSIAKYITKTKVVTESGDKPDFQTILIRSLCRFIPFEPFSFLASGSGWHDKLSKTKVVEV